MNRSTNRCHALAAAMTLAMLAGAAYGQSAPKKDEPALRGPKVTEGGAPGENRKFSGGGGPRERMERETPHRLFVRAFDVLRGDKADGSLALTTAQDESLKTLDSEFRDAGESYRAEHRDEVMALRDKLPQQERRRVDALLGGPRQPGGPDRPRDRKPQGDDMQRDEMQGDAPSAKEAEEAKARLREIIEGAPKVSDTHAKMFAVLTEAQKPVVTKEIERLKSEAAKRRPQSNDANKPAATERERLRERLKNLPPEERERILRERREKQDKNGTKGPQDRKPG